MRRQVYLKRDSKTGVYKFRRDYPADVKAALGKNTFILSLHTKDLKEANERAAEASNSYQARINFTRCQSLVPESERRQIAKEISNYNILPEPIEDIDLATVKTVIKQLNKSAIDIKGNKLPEGHASVLYKKLCEVEDRFKQGFKDYIPSKDDIEWQVKTRSHINSSSRADVVDKLMSMVQSVYIPPKTSSKCPKLSEAYEFWCAGGKEYRNKLHMGMSVRLLTEWAGDKFLDYYTREEINSFAEILAKVPMQLPKEYSNSSLKFLERAVETGKLSGEARSAATIKGILGALSALYKAAEDKLDIEIKNPIKKVKVKNSKKSVPRINYSIDDLKLLFNSPIYRGCKSEFFRWQDGNKIIKDEKYWLPLIAIFNGARLNEIGQLVVSDIKNENGVFYFDINESHEHKRIKTQSSARKVPVHNELVKCGFIDYYEQRAKSGKDALLFPNLTVSKDGRITKAYSQWYSRYSKRIGLKKKDAGYKKDFHSFRHSFVTSCSGSGIPPEISMEFVGHEDDGSSLIKASLIHRGYSHKNMKELGIMMQKLNYEGLDLSHLHSSVSKPRVFKVKRRKK